MDYNKRYTYIIIVLQYKSFYIMQCDNNPIRSQLWSDNTTLQHKRYGTLEELLVSLGNLAYQCNQANNNKKKTFTSVQVSNSICNILLLYLPVLHALTLVSIIDLILDISIIWNQILQGHVFIRKHIENIIIIIITTNRIRHNRFATFNFSNLRPHISRFVSPECFIIFLLIVLLLYDI